MLERGDKPLSALLAGLALVTAQAVPAQSVSEAESTPAGDELESIVGTGAPVPGEPLLQSSQVDVLQGDDKARQEGASLGETLDSLAGVASIGAGNGVGKPVIRGLSGQRVRLLSGGVGVDHQQFGARHSPNIDPFLSDRIELVRGAQSVLYGSDALGGAGNVLPMAIPYGEPLAGDSLVRYRSNNAQWDTGLRLGGGSDDLGFSAALIRHSAGNIETPDEPTYFPPPPADPALRDEPAYTGELDYTGFEQLNGRVAAGWRGLGGDWSLQYTRWDDEHEFLLPPPAGMKPPPAGEEGVGQWLDNEELRAAGEFRHAGITWKPVLMWQNTRRRSNAAGNDLGVPFDGSIDLEFDRYTARLEGVHGPVLGLDGGRVGIEYATKDQVSRGRVQLSPGGDVDNLALFAFEERAFGPLLIQAGLRFDHHETVARESKTESADTNFSGTSRNSYDVFTGSIGGTLQLSSEVALAANVGRGFRAPSLFELHANGVHGGVAAVQRGNPDLEEETSLNTDLSLRWVSSEVRMIATVYRNVIDDYIYPRDTGATQGGLPVFEYTQGKAQLHGAELSVERRVTSWLTLSGTAEAVEGELRGSGDDLPLMPADNLRVAAEFAPGEWGVLRDPYLELGVTFVASKDAAPGEPFSQFDNAPFGSASTDSYQLVDLSAGVGVPLGGRTADLGLRVTNLTDETYRAFLDTYKGYALSPGRDIRLTARVPFGF